MPSFAGIDLGPFCKIKPRPNRTEIQPITYPGINGVGGLNLGARGFTTEAEIGIYGIDEMALAATLSSLWAAQQTATRGTLIDSLGISWANVVLVEIFPTDDIVQLPSFGIGWEHHLEFFHFS